jgi:hypothetical protein
MRYDDGQFKGFDTLENRRDVFLLLKRLGDGVPDQAGNERRAGFLQGLIYMHDSPFVGKPMTVEPCTAIEAFQLFGAITGCLGIDAERAAIILEKLVQHLTGGKDTSDDRRALICGS